MPVIGHAFVGLAVAEGIRPARSGRLDRAWWAPTLVVLSYLPDIVAQAAGLFRLDWRMPAHSVVVGLVVAPLLAIPLAKYFSTAYGRVVLATSACIGLHDLFDLLQATDRRPFWPLSDRIIGTESGVWPVGPAFEWVSFGGAYAVLWVILRTRRRRATQDTPATLPRRRSQVRPARAASAAVLLAALTTHYLRYSRERDYAEIQVALSRRDYPAVFAQADRAERWPSTTKPGRIDYARAEAYRGLGNVATAEEYYLGACAADPTYFWAVADLAVMYAKSDGLAAVRRAQVAPWLELLKERFSNHEAYGRMTAKIERLLEASAD